MLRALIVDDEPPARDELKFLLSKEKNIAVAGEADSGPDAVRIAAQVNPDVVFLDVEMRGLNGMETATILRGVVPDALVVFATAYDEYAVQAFELGAIDYILKPFETERIHTTIERINGYKPTEWTAASQRLDHVINKGKVSIHKLPVEKYKKIMLIDYDHISYISTDAGGVKVVAGDETYTYSGTLTELEERLVGTSLVRVHKSYIVNLEKVCEVIPWFKGTYWLKVTGCPNREIPVSKAQIKVLKDMLGLK